QTSACVLRHVSRTSRSVVAAFDRALKPSGLTGHQFNLLMTLAEAGPMNVTALARYVGVDPTTVPRALAPLRRERLVDVRTADDRRERVVALTSEGRRRLAGAVPLWESVQQALLDSFGHGDWESLIADL